MGVLLCSNSSLQPVYMWNNHYVSKINRPDFVDAHVLKTGNWVQIWHTMHMKSKLHLPLKENTIALYEVLFLARPYNVLEGNKLWLNT